MVEARNRMNAAELQMRSAQKRERMQQLTAPVDGTVQQLQVRTIGGVVQPAQVLMVIVPKDTVLEADIMVLNKDKGFGVKIGGAYGTGNAQRYGLNSDNDLIGLLTTGITS